MSTPKKLKSSPTEFKDSILRFEGKGQEKHGFNWKKYLLLFYSTSCTFSCYLTVLK